MYTFAKPPHDLPKVWFPNCFHVLLFSWKTPPLEKNPFARGFSCFHKPFLNYIWSIPFLNLTEMVSLEKNNIIPATDPKLCVCVRSRGVAAESLEI